LQNMTVKNSTEDLEEHEQMKADGFRKQSPVL
jgi:hypothetical protein